jgi:hypothetical protein
MPAPVTGHRSASEAGAARFDRFTHDMCNALAASLGRIELLERHLRRGTISRDDTLASLSLAATQIRRAGALMSSFDSAQAPSGRTDESMHVDA